MNLKLRRLVRTPHSEQYALFDLDRTDDNYDPLSMGKLDLHYTSDGVYGTFLLWTGAIADLPANQVQELVEATVQEVCEPRGIPTFYAIEYFSPDLESYVYHMAGEAADDGDEHGHGDSPSEEQISGNQSMTCL